MTTPKGVPAVAREDRLDEVISGIDRRIAAQLDVILHHPSFVALEGAWRGLAFVVERVPPGENVDLWMLNASRADLHADLARGDGVEASGLHRLIYDEAFRHDAGEPYAAVVADWTFAGTNQDVDFLHWIGSVVQVAHTVFLAGASPEVAGVAPAEDEALFREGASAERGLNAAWSALRDDPVASALGLAFPRFLLRADYRDIALPDGARYDERVDDESRVWGHASLALATRLVDSFVRYRWCPNIVGRAGGGWLDGLPSRVDENGRASATEIDVGPLPEWSDAPGTPPDVPSDAAGGVAARGVIPLVACGSGEACFPYAPSLLAPRTFGDTEEGLAAATNHKLGCQLPYWLVAARLAQYAKLVYRSSDAAREPITRLVGEIPGHLGSSIEERYGLDHWLDRHTANRDVLTQATRPLRIVRKVKIRLTGDHTDEWRAFDIQLRPMFKFPRGRNEGVFFTLIASGRFDRRAPERS